MHRYTPEGAVLQESGLAKQSRHEQSSSHLLFPIMLNFATTDTAGHTNRGQSPRVRCVMKGGTFHGGMGGCRLFLFFFFRLFLCVFPFSSVYSLSCFSPFLSRNCVFFRAANRLLLFILLFIFFICFFPDLTC